ncbi:restriction endonuclease subunit S [Knoellia locipacati]|uniref:restriction endonuclease subunit S n=1 Tax=Knoellia locipacati TaxID=882824 RepID=UPI00384D5706
MSERRVVRLGEVADVGWGDTATTKSAYALDGYPAFSASGPDGFLPWAQFNGPGIVLSAIGAQAGRTWLASGEWSTIKNTIRILPKDPSVSIEFLYWVTRDPSIWPIRGSAQPFISQGDARDLLVSLPDLQQQRGIAEVLGALDDKIAANAALAQSADALAGPVFARACTDPDVSAAPLGSLATMVLGGTPSRTNEAYWRDGTVPWLNSGKANEQRVISPSELITEEALAKSAAKMMPIGATVLAITGATLGQVARLEIEACGNQSLVGVWGPSDADTDWIHFAVREAIPELLKSATGAAQQHVNKQAVANLPIITASKETVAKFGAAVRPLLSRAAQADRESAVLAETRDALLPQLMSGKIRVKDAERVVEEVV